MISRWDARISGTSARGSPAGLQGPGRLL